LSKVEKLSPRKAKYVKARATGMPKKKAAIEAGYSVATAHNAGVKIEKQPDVQAAFREIVRRTCTEQRIVERLSEGLDATRLFMSGEGDDRHVEMEPDYRERREYLKLAAGWGGLVPKDQPDTIIPIQVVIDL
jgi:hypothetical protein